MDGPLTIRADRMNAGPPDTAPLDAGRTNADRTNGAGERPARKGPLGALPVPGGPHPRPPTGLAASDLAAYAVLLLARGTEPAGLLGRSRAYVADRRAAYHEDWLGDLWTYSPDPSSAHFTARGWDGGPGRTLGQRYRRQRYRRR